MRRTSTIAAIAVLLTLAACGGDSGPELSESQAAAAQSAVDSAAEGGVTLDQSCVNDVAAQLSDEDAVIAAADPDADLSPEGEALSLSLLECADPDEIVDLFVASLADSGQPFDEDCVREKIDDFGIDKLIASANDDDIPAELGTALTECLDG